jgi:hypothetical protein
MKLEEVGEALAYEAAFDMQGFENPNYPIEKLGELSLQVSDKLRCLAIIALLVNADPDNFYHNLIRSGISRKTYMERLKKKGIEQDHHRVSGRYEALLDAIAASDLELARRIAALSPDTWQKGHEYEDDYCYAQILHCLIQDAPAEKEIAPLLTQLETCLKGEPSARLDLCRALTARNQVEFDDAFEMLLKEQEAKIAADKARAQFEEPIVMANRMVFVEGLAILRLAEKQGLKTQSEYLYCPSLARVPMKTPFPGE